MYTLKKIRIVFLFLIIAIFVLSLALFADRSNNDSEDELIRQEIIRIIQTQLGEAGFDFRIPEDQDNLQVTATSDSIGGQVVAEIILVNEEKGIRIALIDRTQTFFVFPEHRLMVSLLIRRTFEHQHDTTVSKVFFNFGKAVADSREIDTSLEASEQDITLQIQDFIEQLDIDVFGECLDR